MTSLVAKEIAQVQPIYDDIAARGLAVFRQGTVQTDPHLLNIPGDTRRGTTLRIRPTDPARQLILDAAAELDRIVPGQYVYTGDQLHITVLSVISAAEGIRLEDVPLDACNAIFADVCRRAAPFTIRLRGIVASPDCVLVCGYPDRDALNTLRDHLRAALKAAGLASALEQRYRSVTAHLSLLRFQTVPYHVPPLLEWLEEARARDLGAFVADSVEWVFNDWFMSPGVVQLLGRYPLAGQG